MPGDIAATTHTAQGKKILAIFFLNDNTVKHFLGKNCIASHFFPQFFFFFFLLLSVYRNEGQFIFPSLLSFVVVW